MTTPAGPEAGPAVGRAGGQRWVRLLEELWSSEGAQRTTLLPFILPTVKLPSVNPVFAGRAGVAGVAAQDQAVQLLNPAGSRIRAIIKSCTVIGDLAAATSLWNVRSSAQTLGTLGTSVRVIDARGSSRNLPLCGVFFDADITAAGTLFAALQVLLGDTVEVLEMRGLVLDPGEGVLIDSAANNLDLRVNFVWEEERLRV